MKKLLKLLLLSIYPYSAIADGANSEPIEILKISILSPNMHFSSIPFDIPFIMTGKLEGYKEISYTYRIINNETRNKRWVSFPNPKDPNFSANDERYESEVYTIGSDDSFRMYCPGIHPNIDYEFVFKIVKDVSIEKASIEELKVKIANRLSNFFKENPDNISPSDIDNEERAITEIVKVHLNLTGTQDQLLIFNDSGGMVQYRTNFQNGFVEPVRSLNVIFNNIHTTDKNLQGNISTAIQYMNNAILYNEVLNVLSNDLKFTNRTKHALESKFNPSLSDFKDYSLYDGLEIIRKLLATPNTYRDILNGTLKIYNKDFVSVDNIDTQSLFFISSVLHVINDGFIQDTQSKSPVVIRTSSSFNNIHQLMQQHDDVLHDIREKISLQKELETVKNLIPDVTANLLIRKTTNQRVITVPDVVTSKTPYISAEAGIGFCPAFTTAFYYTGANFYVEPINKKARLSTFKGTYRFAKMFCFNISLAHLFSSRPENSYSILGNTTDQMLIIGTGLRLNRIIKVNTGIMPYKSNRNNPLINSYDIKAAWYVSAGVDINLLGALGDLGSYLGKLVK